MAVESDTDRAAFFDTGEFGVAGTYTPDGGDAVTVAVILDQPVAEAEPGLVNVSARFYRARLRASEVALPAPGDVLTIGGTDYQVGEASLDVTGRIWTVRLSA